ncbi:MAG: hypothetical protein MJ244_04350 [Clostridia bacterium]|nr:hypothetical protein [Clostridia bacterium]
MTYKLMKAKIQRSDLQDLGVVDSLYEMLDTFLIGNRITNYEYNELVSMLPKLESEY